MADDLDAVLTELVVQSPADQQRLVGLIRATCGDTLSLTPLPAQTPVSAPETDAEKVVAEFAEQFSVDVSAISDRQRESLTTALGAGAFGAVIQMFFADFLPRVRNGLEVLGPAGGLGARGAGVGPGHRRRRRAVQPAAARGGAAASRWTR